MDAICLGLEEMAQNLTVFILTRSFDKPIHLAPISNVTFHTRELQSLVMCPDHNTPPALLLQRKSPSDRTNIFLRARYLSV